MAVNKKIKKKIWVYGNLEIINNEKAKEITLKLYNETLKDYWSDRRKVVEDLYQDLSFPFPENIKKKEFELLKEYSIESYVNYISSWSAIEDYYKKNENTDLLLNFKNE